MLLKENHWSKKFQSLDRDWRVTIIKRENNLESFQNRHWASRHIYRATCRNKNLLLLVKTMWWRWQVPMSNFLFILNMFLLILNQSFKIWFETFFYTGMRTILMITFQALTFSNLVIKIYKLLGIKSLWNCSSFNYFIMHLAYPVQFSSINNPLLGTFSVEDKFLLKIRLSLPNLSIAAMYQAKS